MKDFRKRKLNKKRVFVCIILPIYILLVCIIASLVSAEEQKRERILLAFTMENSIILQDIEEQPEKKVIVEEDKTVIKQEQQEQEKEIIEEKKENNNSFLGKYKLTAYCACAKCCGKTNGITASGTKAQAGRTVAAASDLAFGTKLSINGHTYTVEDRGGAIKGNKIDIFFDSHEEALAFGVKYADVYKII